MSGPYSLGATEGLRDSDIVKEIVSPGLSYHTYLNGETSSTTLLPGTIVELIGTAIKAVDTAGNAMGVVVRQAENTSDYEDWLLVVDFGATVNYAHLDFNGCVEATTIAALKTNSEIKVLTPGTFSIPE